ncbi:hypothetical protein GGS20DRAFT_580825 [Poronia punctata]|nr:hypothetical protein GGS20DRAFT_580825 [Poronia punctata]
MRPTPFLPNQENAIQQIFNFPTVFIENIHVLPTGNLLLTTMEPPNLLYILDPNSPNPETKPAARFNSTVTGLTGIVPLDGDLGSFHVYIVSLQTGSVVNSIPVPDTATLNGMAALPRNPHIILGADSIDKRIFTIDTHAALAPSIGVLGIPPIGINGLRIREEFLYFTNSNQGTFSRFRIDDHGNKICGIEILARRNVYIAVYPSSVVKVTPEGMQERIAGLEAESSLVLKEPTSIALARDGKSFYVVTGGLFYADPREGGQVVQIHL